MQVQHECFDHDNLDNGNVYFSLIILVIFAFFLCPSTHGDDRLTGFRAGRVQRLADAGVAEETVPEAVPRRGG